MSDASQDPVLEAELALELPPEETVAEAPPDDGAMGVQGQWVWQYGAPPPPPSFGAAFFSGHAHAEHYRFFACGLLVVLGCLLPWGPVEATTVGRTALVTPPDVSGYETTGGAISLVIGLWLVAAACYGVYTGRHRILPVFLMLEPAYVTWTRTLDAWGRLQAPDTLGQVQELFEVAGTGVLLALLGSTFVSVGFLLLLGKVYTKKDAKRPGRERPAKDKDKEGGGQVAPTSAAAAQGPSEGQPLEPLAGPSGGAPPSGGGQAATAAPPPAGAVTSGGGAAEPSAEQRPNARGRRGRRR